MGNQHGDPSTIDAIFIRNLILGDNKSTKGVVTELAYTPDDMEYIEENLLRQGFKLSIERPFVRKNKQKQNCRSEDSLELVIEVLF